MLRSMPSPLRPVQEHLDLVLAGVTALPSLAMGITAARGCVLAEDVAAPWPLPPFDNSAMDGYAVRVADVAAASAENPVSLRVVDDVPAGYRATHAVEPGTAIRIMTGALVPEGAEAVVPVEDSDAGTEQVSVRAATAPGRYLRRAGEEIAAGTVVAAAGTVITPRHVGLLASVGRATVLAHPHPRVVVISTGSELVEPGQPLSPGLIPDSNGVMLTAAAEEAGAHAFRVGPVADDPDVFLRTLDDQLARADVVVTSGGVSAGAYDTVKAVLRERTGVEFVKVAMQPGMPQGHGRVGAAGVPLFTLPGNPVSAYVSFEVFVRPVIRMLAGHRHVHRPVVRAVCLADLDSPVGKQQFLRARLTVVDGTWAVEPVGGAGSHLVAGLAGADALLLVPAQVGHVAAGEPVTVMRLDVDPPTG